MAEIEKVCVDLSGSVAMVVVWYNWERGIDWKGRQESHDVQNPRGGRRQQDRPHKWRVREERVTFTEQEGKEKQVRILSNLYQKGGKL